MSKHTPGPWRYWECRVDSSANPPMYDYAQFANSKQDHVFRAPLLYLREADARLIAAAPDLLEACVAYLADRAEAGCTSDPASVKAMRAAIQRATGES